MTDKEIEQIDTIDLLYPVLDYLEDPVLRWVIEGSERKTIYSHLYSGAGGKGLPKKENLNKFFK